MGGFGIETIRVLLLEDDPGDASRVRAALVRPATTATVELTHVDRLLDALRALTTLRFDAVLLDLTVPHVDWTAALRRIREQAPEVPVIVLTSVDDDVTAVRALKEGAQDSLVKKELDSSLLIRSIRYAIERHQLRIALEAMALVDELTGLYNRRGFMTLARQQLKIADRMAKRVSLVFVDVDRMKWINDTFGHRDGDLALREAADLLRDTFRDSDIIARIGGDEFVVLAMETSGMPPDTLATRLASNLDRRNARTERRFPLDVSVGVASYAPEEPTTIEALMERADELMYEDKKRKGRGARAAG